MSSGASVEIVVSNEELANTRPKSNPISLAWRNYYIALQSISQTVGIVMPHMITWIEGEHKKLQKRLAHFLPEEPGDAKIEFKSTHDFIEFTSTIKKLQDLRQSQQRAVPVLARSLFMQIFSEFDAFTGALLKAIYQKKPDLLKSISREISLVELLEYGDIEAAKMAILDKEIETIRRGSYIEQFAHLGKRFSIELHKFPEWGEFIELSQRRNLCTHNDGRVSDQYISVCQKEGWCFATKPVIGELLGVDAQYLRRALNLMTKVGFMLSHTLWSRIFDTEHEEMHQSLTESVYECLEKKRWKLAVELGEFSLVSPMRKNLADIDLRIRIINFAIGLKFSERNAEAKKCLDSVDWSASYRDFRLARYVLSDEFDQAINLMKEIGKSGEIVRQKDYHSWPLFHKFRERPEFYQAYESIYGESYTTKTQQGVEREVVLSSTDDVAQPAKADDRPQKPKSTRRPKAPKKGMNETTAMKI